MPKSSTNQVIDIINSGYIEQPRHISNEMLQNYSEGRLKIELGKYKRESLGIMSDKLVGRVTEDKVDSPIAHIVTYKGYFINEEEFDRIKEALNWTPEKAVDGEKVTAPEVQSDGK